jgi:hypothetical protein
LDHRNPGLRRLQKEEKSFAVSISMMIMENTMPPTLDGSDHGRVRGAPLGIDKPAGKPRIAVV